MKSNKVNTSTNIDEPSPDHENYTKVNDLDTDLPFPLIEIETADSLWNSINLNHLQGSPLNDSEYHQHHSSNIFDSSASAIFDESEIDIENASFVSEISSLAFSTSNISTFQSPSTHKSQKRSNRNLNNSISASSKRVRRKKKSKNKSESEDDFLFNSPKHFFDYYQNYYDPFMPPALFQRWKSKQLAIRKEIICAYRAEDSRLTNFNIESAEQRLREEEEARREKIVEFGIARSIEKTTPIFDDQDKELEINQTPLSHALSSGKKNNKYDLQNIEEREKEIAIQGNESINENLYTNQKVNPLLILSLAIRFLFYIGYLLDLC